MSPFSQLAQEFQGLAHLRDALTTPVTPSNRLSRQGWYTCVEAALVETSVLECMAADMAPPAGSGPMGGAGGDVTGPAVPVPVTPLTAKLEVFPVLQALLARRDRDADALRGYVHGLFDVFPAQLYLLSRAVETFGRDHVCRVVHHPKNIAALNGAVWLKPFQIIYPPHIAEDGCAFVCCVGRIFGRLSAL